MFDLRNELYRHLQKQSLRFFTDQQDRRADVAGDERRQRHRERGHRHASSASSRTPSSLVSVMVVIVGLNWRLALLSLVMLPFFIFPTRRVGPHPPAASAPDRRVSGGRWRR